MTGDKAAERAHRDGTGRFAGGNKGRPRGTRNRTTLAAQALLEGEAKKLGRKAVDLALAGDVTALRLCLERVVPARRPQGATIDLPELANAVTLADKAMVLLDAVGAGRVPPDVAKALIESLAGVARIREVDELERRIAALEAK